MSNIYSNNEGLAQQTTHQCSVAGGVMRRLMMAVCVTTFLAVNLYSPKQSAAQEQLLGPSMSLEDATSQFANPALMSFQRSKIALGAKAYHLGVGGSGGAPLRQGYVMFSSPFFLMDRFGIGTHVQYFDSPIYSRMAIGGSFSARVLPFLSVGVRVEALNLSYNQNEFVGFDPADPVFADGFGKTVLTTSLGVFAQPLPNLRLSAGFRNLNRPNLSLAGDEFRQSIESFLGIGYGVGPAMALFEVIDTFYGLETRFGVEAVATSGSFVRLSSNSTFDLGRLEGQLHVGGPISVHYGYELPLGDLGPSSNGSHTFSVVFDFGRVPELPDPINIPSYLYSNSIPEITPQLAPKVYISASTDYVRFYEQQIVRTVDDDVPYEAIQQLSRKDLGVLDSTFVQNQAQIPDEVIDEISTEVALQGSYSPLYQASIRELGKALAADSLKGLTISGPGSQLMKAAGVRNRLVQNGPAPTDQIKITVPRDADTQAEAAAKAAFLPRENLVLYEPDHTMLFLNSSFLLENVQSWEMKISDMDGQVVKTFSGNDLLPTSLSWDWRGDDGQHIAPGVYRYGLEWVDLTGNAYSSNERKLYVQKMLRKITIEVTRDIEAIRKEADAVEIRIQH
ncbi:MAG: hypothetical protein AB8G77_24710 [Rhodothermales bacterium]